MAQIVSKKKTKPWNIKAPSPRTLWSNRFANAKTTKTAAPTAVETSNILRVNAACPSSTTVVSHISNRTDSATIPPKRLQIPESKHRLGTSPSTPITIVSAEDETEETSSRPDSPITEVIDADESSSMARSSSNVPSHRVDIEATENSYVNNEAPPAAADWAIPRWKELETKRLALCQQRVQLERRLFEFSQNGMMRKQIQLQKDSPKSSKTNNVTSSSASTDSQVSHDGSTGNNKVNNNDELNMISNSCQIVDPKDNKNFKLRRFQLKKDQDPVLWSGGVNQKGQPEGIGRMVFSDGQVYEGMVKGGQRQGKGVNVWPNGQVYTGTWTCNSRSGRGTHTWPDGRSVTGPWLNGHLQGRVFFRWPDGATYDGDTVKGQKEGRGIHTWKDGKVYSGQYKNGAENGFGTLTERDQLKKYRGQFNDGKRHGYGIQIWPNKTYDGEWQQNVFHGRGKLTWLSGACYTGEFEHGNFHGHGCYRSEAGLKYVGEWFDGRKHGQGKQYWPDGRIYDGSFRLNKRHGYGRMEFPDGTVYSGGWDRGHRAGRGIEVTSVTDESNGLTNNVIKHCGMWHHDEAIFEDKELLSRKSLDDLQLNAKPSNMVKNRYDSRGLHSDSDDYTEKRRTCLDPRAEI